MSAACTCGTSITEGIVHHPYCPDARRSADDHLSWWDAARFYWHFRRHPDHADTVWYDDRAGLVRCPCGKTWGA